MALDLSRDGYTHEQIRDVLHMTKGSRKIRFKYFILDSQERTLGELTSVTDGSIDQNAFSDIKRTAKLTIRGDTYKNAQTGEDEPINWNSHRVQIFIEFEIPEEYRKGDTQKKKWVSFPQGIFLISTPTKKEKGGEVYREVEAYDKLLITKEDKVTERYTIQPGAKYYDEMVKILNSAGIQKINIENDEKTLPTAKEYEPGTEKLSILNDLASDLGFTQFWVDEYGYFRSSKYRAPGDQPEDYVYQDDEISVTTPGTEEELDVFNLPNVFMVVVANPDTDEEFVATIENNNKNHPRSIPSLNRRVVRVENKDNTADQEALEAYAERIAQEASQIFGKVKFSTAIMPFHSYSNIIVFRNRDLGISNKYLETSWSIKLKEGAEMNHEARRTVSLV